MHGLLRELRAVDVRLFNSLINPGIILGILELTI